MPTCKPLRQWLGGLDGLRQVVVDPGYGWNEPTLRAESIVRADPARARRRAREPDRGNEDAGAMAGRHGVETEASAAAARSRPSSRASTPRRSRASTPRSASAYADGDLVYTASSMPIRDQEAFLAPGPADGRVPLQPRRERHRRARLVRDRRRGGERPADLDRAPATSACSTT